MKIKKIIIILLALLVIMCINNNCVYSAEETKPEIKSRADEWIKIGEDEDNTTANMDTATNGFLEIAGLLFGIGIFIAVAVGMILGIKFLTSSPSGKAEVSNLITPYIIGVAVIVGAATIWKVAIEILDV